MDEAAFLELLLTYFPSIYDVKYMMTAVEGLHGGLSSLADSLKIERIGPMHQAGSDSLLTAQTFFALVLKNFGGVAETNFKGELFDMGNNHTNSASSARREDSSNVTASPQLQYNNTVHYPHAPQLNLNQLPSNGST
eukprot:gene32734-40403_t